MSSPQSASGGTGGKNHETSPDQNPSGVWSRAAGTYGQVGPPFFKYFGERLVELARIPRGGRVLDVAAGRGALLFPAIDQVGPGGEVVGIDFAEGMVRETGAEIASRDITNARMLQMDAQNLEFPDNSFDCVLCGFAVFFFPDRARACSEFHRVLKPGGTMAFTTWTAWDSRWDWLDNLVAEITGRDENAEDDSPLFVEPEGMPDIVARSGFADVRVTPEEKTFYYKDPEEWWNTQWSHGGRFFLEKLSPREQDLVRAGAVPKLDEMRQPEGLPVTLYANYFVATKPAS